MKALSYQPGVILERKDMVGMPTPMTWHVGAFLLAVACGEAAGVTGNPPAVGTYLLESVDGCAPGLEAKQCFPRPSWVIDGTMVMAADGRVTRTMRYQFPGDANPVTLVAIGTYAQRGDSVRFALREDTAASPHIWRPRAALSDSALILRYPHPADGEILEVFSRQ